MKRSAFTSKPGRRLGSTGLKNGKALPVGPKQETKLRVARQMGAALRQSRMDADVSQDVLAEALGVTRRCIQGWESGTAIPRLYDVVRVSQALGVPVDHLVYAVG